MDPIPLRLDAIQGNILFGFNKDFQDFFVLSFANAAAVRDWIREITRSAVGIENSSAAAVQQFNASFKRLRPLPGVSLSAEWVHLAFAHRGLALLKDVLGLADAQLDEFPTAFREGMAMRADILGDEGGNGPDHWIDPFADGCVRVHALLIVAADSEAALNNRTEAIRGTDAFKAAFGQGCVRFQGRTRPDAPGHEHFGFKDGISQPGIRLHPDGEVPADNGQNLLWPGEFVLGYPTQIGHAHPEHAGANPDPGPVSTAGPEWTRDGSFMVFRRLQQNVRGFQEQVDGIASAQGMPVADAEAKLVGRFKSGDLLPACPLAAHIQKAYPRDPAVLAGNRDMASAVETHRLLRRGIPYGPSFDPAHPDDRDRGLLFVTYQSKLEGQFEFVQQKWMNFAKFPDMAMTVGQDPISAMSVRGPFQWAQGERTMDIEHFVTMTGGEYFFSPSIAALRAMAGL